MALYFKQLCSDALYTGLDILSPHIKVEKAEAKGRIVIGEADIVALSALMMTSMMAIKAKYVSYGGNGYNHILRNIVPQMLVRGITREQIHTILVENPKLLSQFATNKSS